MHKLKLSVTANAQDLEPANLSEFTVNNAEMAFVFFQMLCSELFIIPEKIQFDCVSLFYFQMAVCHQSQKARKLELRGMMLVNSRSSALLFLYVLIYAFICTCI